MTPIVKSPANTLYLIYDNDCLLCRNSAKAIKVKKTVGHLELIDARTTHQRVTDAFNKGYDLNTGILINYNNQY
jgi:predicted DCC family thiol-disulfide oxidoreductase YuxK